VSSPPASASRVPRREALLAYLACMLTLMVAVAASYAFSPIRANLLAIAAAAFLLVPRFALPRDNPGPDAYGLALRDGPRAILTGVVASVIVLAGFLPAFHLWNTHAHDLHLDPTARALLRPPERLTSAPATTDDGRVHIFHVDGWVSVRWTPQADEHAILRAHADAPMRVYRGQPRTLIQTATTHGEHLRIAFIPRDATTFRVEALRDGEHLALHDFALGYNAATPRDRDAHPDGGLEFRRTFGWIPLAILVQLLLVALPEEFFFRGYLQKRFDEGRPPPRGVSIGPIRITTTNLLVSALFALAHIVTEFHPARLAVFFPSLLFGALRDRTDGIVAPIILHAACNLMVQVAIVHYIPA